MTGYKHASLDAAAIQLLAALDLRSRPELRERVCSLNVASRKVRSRFRRPRVGRW